MKGSALSTLARTRQTNAPRPRAAQHRYALAPRAELPVREVVSAADIVAILKRHGSIDAAYALAVEFSNKAREAICPFPDSEIKRVLLWVPEFVVERES